MPARPLPLLAWLAALAVSLLFCVCGTSRELPPGANVAPQTGESTFTDREASQLLKQIADALASHNTKKMLAVFDTGKMSGGPEFRQQINSFFSQTAAIRVHFNLVQAGPAEGRNVVAVDAEIEADPVDDRLPPVHKQAQLHFLAEGSGGAWKFTDVQPRTFFSNAQP